MEISTYLQYKSKYMYSLNCSYYTEQFPSLQALINDALEKGMDPNYEIMYNGEGTGEELIDHIAF